jgi:predicted metalloprotease
MMPAGYQPPVISGGYGSAVDGPVCAGDPALEGNAFYCPSGDFLAWDEPGLLVPIFLEVGDMAVAFILAHEWAHAIQQRAGFSYKFTIQAELQADCYAGAWAADAKGRGIVEPGDLDEVIQGLFLARDIPGRPWFDEQAHGSGFQRVRAFNFGFDNGAAACNAYIVSGPE